MGPPYATYDNVINMIPIIIIVAALTCKGVNIAKSSVKNLSTAF